MLEEPASPVRWGSAPLAHLTQAVTSPQIPLCLTWSADNPNTTYMAEQATTRSSGGQCVPLHRQVTSSLLLFASHQHI